MTKTLLIADGPIASTEIVRRLLQTAFDDTAVVYADRWPAALPAHELLVLSRLCSPRLAWLPEYLVGKGQPYVYFLDDNLFELTDAQDVSNAAYYGHPAVRSSLLKFLEHAAAVWVMSRALQSYLQQRLGLRNIQYLPAPVDLQLFAQTTPNDGGRRTPAVVGYPTSRRLNVAGLLTEIVELTERRLGERVHFEFVGWWPDAIVGRNNVSSVPHMPVYEDFARFVANRQWLAALAPVSDSLFENCKTSVKYREYGAARVPGIYSDTPLYQGEVTHGSNGMLARNDAVAWVDAIERLLDDDALRQGIADAAFDDVLRKHEQGAVARRTHDAFAPLARPRAVVAGNLGDT